MRSWDYQTTTWHSTPPKQRKSSLTSEGTDTAPLYIKCREGSDIQIPRHPSSQQTSHGQPTPQQSLSTFWECWRTTTWRRSCWRPSIALQWRARWDTVAQYGTAAVLRQRERADIACPLWRTSTTPAASAELRTLKKTAVQPAALRQALQVHHGQTDSRTASSSEI